MAEAGTNLDMIDDVEMSLTGMTFLLNNDWQKASELFLKHKDDSALMCAGNGMVIFMRALMTFEDEQLLNANKILQETKKKCESSKNFTLSRMKKSNKKRKSSGEVEDKLQRQIIIADCVIYQAVLTFMNQDISSYIKGGWMLRKAYKIYEKLYKEIKKIHAKLPHKTTSQQSATSSTSRKVECETSDKHDQSGTSTNQAFAYGDATSQNDVNNHTPSNESSANNTHSTDSNPSVDSISRDESTESFEVDTIEDGQLTREAAERLFGSVSFGYGTFQLAISLVPPKILKIIEFLGFDGDREQGLEALDVACHSRDMKAPLASLALIWYHTVIRPFFALDGNDTAAGVDDALKLIKKSEERYPNSALFLFFKGRAQRLKGELREARETFATAVTSCDGQREIQLICYHEIGWIAMLQRDWPESIKCFKKLREESRWSKSYYAFLTGLSEGANGNLSAAVVQFELAPQLVKRKNNQIEQFVMKRTERLLKDGGSVTKEHCTLMILEILYLWNALSQCQQQDRQDMLTALECVNDPSLFHLKSLIAGALHNEIGNTERAKQCFREAIARQEELSKQEKKDDTHVTAFALYELGILLASQPETYNEGKQNLLQARDGYKEYDFDNRLSIRINAALRRIKQEGTPL